MSSYTQLLVAIDLSDQSRAIAAKSVELARQWQAQLRLLHVIEYVPVEPMSDALVPVQLRADGGVALLPEPGPGDSVAQLRLDAPIACVPDGMRSTLQRGHELFAQLEAEPVDGFNVTLGMPEPFASLAEQSGAVRTPEGLRPVLEDVSFAIDAGFISSSPRLENSSAPVSNHVVAAAIVDARVLDMAGKSMEA